MTGPAPALKHRLKAIPILDWANAAWKGRCQDRLAERNQAFYRRQAAEHPPRCPEGDALPRAVRSRLAERAAGRWPKAKGDLHLFFAGAIHNWEAVLPRSLEPFGRVTTFDWRALGFDELAPDWLSHRDAMNAALLAQFQHANRRQPVDAVIGYLSGHNTAPEVLHQLARAGAAIFNYCLDDKLRFPGRKLGGRYTSPAALAEAVDLNLTNAPESVFKYAVHGGLAMFWPEAADPEFHRPYETPFEFDVAFVGARYGWRPAFMRALGRRGIRVECFGRGWPNGPLRSAEMVRLYSRSRINLGFGGVGHSQRLLCLKGRDFEVPMSGGLYLTQHNPELAQVFELGREVVTYRQVADCARTIRKLLAEPDRAAAIRQAARARCLRDHTYERRWTDLFTLTGLLSPP